MTVPLATDVSIQYSSSGGGGGGGPRAVNIHQNMVRK